MRDHAESNDATAAPLLKGATGSVATGGVRAVQAQRKSDSAQTDPACERTFIRRTDDWRPDAVNRLDGRDDM
jgi:hypothetical protein